MASAFQAAINLVREGTESIVSKVEEAAVAAVTSSILGVDEKTQKESVKEMADSSKLETGKVSSGQEIPRKNEAELESLRGELSALENEIKTWKSKYTEAVTQKRKAEQESLEETRLLKERLSMLSFKLGNLQENTKDDEVKLQGQIEEIVKVLEGEREHYGREIIELSEQLQTEKSKTNQLQSSVDALRRQCELWEETVSAKEIEIYDLKQKLWRFENEQKGSFGAQIKQEPEAIFNQPKEQEVKLLPTVDLQRLEEESELDQEERMKFMEEEQKKEEESKSYDEPLLSQEEIAERLKQHHKVGAPAVVAGGMRIKQNPKGPHLLAHKPTLVEKRDEKNSEQQFGATAEDTSKQLAKQEQALALEKKEQLLERIAVDRVPAESKAVASTYFPPEAQHGNEKKRTKAGLNLFQSPLHG